MLHIERFQVNMLQENCYVVSDETKECVIIDCGAYYPEERKAIVNYIKENELKRFISLSLMVIWTIISAMTPSIQHSA